MERRLRTPAGTVLLLMLPLSGCEPVERALVRPPAEREADGGASAAGAAPAERPAAEAADPEPPVAVPAEIYYDLTAFDWYRRGEPLVHGGREYRASEEPLALPADQFEPAGRYGGVEYYHWPSRRDAVFVPVFEGYWLPFVDGDAAPEVAE